MKSIFILLMFFYFSSAEKIKTIKKASLTLNLASGAFLISYAIFVKKKNEWRFIKAIRSYKSLSSQILITLGLIYIISLIVFLSIKFYEHRLNKIK